MTEPADSLLPQSQSASSDSLIRKLEQLTPAQRRQLRQKLGQRSLNGNDLIAKVLSALGITHVYGISGVPVHQLLGQCARAGIRVVCGRHQQGATLMAASHNYAAGKLVAAVIVSSGPAITNTTTGVLVAWDNAWPLLVIGGGRGDGPPGMFQALDTQPIFTPITKAVFHLCSAQEIISTLSRAADLAISDRPGPVYIELDQSVLTQTASLTADLSPPRPSFPSFEPTAIAQAAALLQQAERPLLVFGKGVRWSEPYVELAQLTGLGIPFVASPMGQGYLPDDDSANVTPAGSLALSTADVVLSVGARWNWTFRFGAELAENAQLIQIDVHEPELGLNVKPAVGIVGDAQAILQALLMKLGSTSWQSKSGTAAWRAQLATASQEKQQYWRSRIDPTQLPLNLQTMYDAILPLLPRDAITVLEGNFTLEAGLRLVPCYRPASRFTNGSNGCVGVGLPFAIGAKIANPDRLVIAVSGDLSFGMTALELETAVRYQVPIVILVANNQGFCGSLYQHQNYGIDYPERVTMFVPNAQYEVLATAFGGFGATVQTASELTAAITDAIAANVPACINVQIDPTAPNPRH
ncbi:MAG: thiamine pyrophosphate-binding protein [Cyanobacteria bacterium P01_H01_bin.15]